MHQQNKQKFSVQWTPKSFHDRFKSVSCEVLEAVAYVGSLGLGTEPLLLFEILF